MSKDKEESPVFLPKNKLAYEQARDRYIYQNKTYKVIAEELSLMEKQVGDWARKDNWKDKRKQVSDATGRNLDIYIKLNNQLNKELDKEELDAYKLSTLYNLMQKFRGQGSRSEAVQEVGLALLDYTLETYPENTDMIHNFIIQFTEWWLQKSSR